MTAQAGDTFSLPPAARKKNLRAALRARRAALSVSARARAASAVARHLLRLRRLRRARRVALYLAMREELDLQPLIDALRRRRAGPRLFAPAVDARRRMRFVPLRGRGRRRDALGLARARHARPSLHSRPFDLVLVPLLGFDPGGTRLGMGGGYYDRAFGPRPARPGKAARPWLCGCAFDEQGVEVIPREPWDLRLDAVVTPRGLRPCLGGSELDRR